MAGLFITVSPSAGGKTTINRRLQKELEGLKISISYTTRPPRQGDKEGVDYYFVGKSEFEEKIEHGDFVEYAKVHGYYYGTSVAKLNEIISAGFDVILEIDVQGASQIKKKYPQATGIFILPPNFEVLKKRLKDRNTDDEEQIMIRLKDARKELEEVDNYDYIVVNDSLESAVEDMKSIIRAERRKVGNNRKFLENFIADISLKRN